MLLLPLFRNGLPSCHCFFCGTVLAHFAAIRSVTAYFLTSETLSVIAASDPTFLTQVCHLKCNSYSFSARRRNLVSGDCLWRNLIENTESVKVTLQSLADSSYRSAAEGSSFAPTSLVVVCGLCGFWLVARARRHCRASSALQNQICRPFKITKSFA